MKLSEFKGEKAIEVLADIIEPITTILADEDVQKISRDATKSNASAVAVALKKYPKDILFVLAKLDNQDPETYNPNLVEIPKKILEALNDEDLKMLFTSQSQSVEETSSGSAMESTEETDSE